MKMIFYIVSAVLMLLGFATFANAQSALHEIEAFLLLLISSILIVGASIIKAIELGTVKKEDNSFEKAHDAFKKEKDSE